MAELIVSGHFNNLALISDFVTEAAQAAGLTARAAYGLQMAVDEACTNIIEHGYGGNDLGELRLVCHTHSHGLQVVIYHQGPHFDPESVAEPDLQADLIDRPKRGMGLFLMRKLVDTLEFKFDTPEGHQLILFKRRE